MNKSKNGINCKFDIIGLYTIFLKKTIYTLYFHYCNMEQIMDKAIDSIMTALVATIIICAAFIPVVLTQIQTLKDMVADKNSPLFGADIGMYTGLIEVVIVLAIVGILIGIVKAYKDAGAR